MGVDKNDAQTQPSDPQSIEVVGYDPKYRNDFERLNRQWIEFYFSIEPADEKVFADPEATIIKPGGQILFARDTETGQILGTIALVRHPDGQYEAAKMAVDLEVRGRGIGNILGEALLECARAMKVKSIMLVSNTVLAPALGLYRKFGFVEVPNADLSEYERANICFIKYL